MNIHLILLYLMASFYIFAGISHFRIPKFFLAITPKWVPKPKLVNILVGIIEIVLGIMLFFEETRSWAAYGIIALLIAVFLLIFIIIKKQRKKEKE